MLPNFKIPKNLYRDLDSRATWRHHTINEELRLALLTTLDPNYSFNHYDTYRTRLVQSMDRLYTRYIIKSDYKNDKNFVKILFYYKPSVPTEKVIKTLAQITKLDVWSFDFNVELVRRLGYTFVDPFYIDFIEQKERDD